MERKFTYKAFISYTARDSQFVNKLEEWLIKISNDTDPAQKYKFFRDSSYAEVGENVEEELKRKLGESEWLILVCSPFVNECKTGERNWVDFECGYYAYTLGRRDKIVGIISNMAPLSREIDLFYPESIKDLQKELAADMRGDKDWVKEVSRIYAKITGRSFKDVYEITNTFYWKQKYYEIISMAYKKNIEGNHEDALKIMSEIPDKYNPRKIEWNYLKAFCTKSAYYNYCGSLNQYAGNKVICFDKKSSYAYSTDNKYIYIINCLKAKVISVIKAHNGEKFRFFYIKEGCIGTFDDCITVKIWNYNREKINLIKQITIEIQFTDTKFAVFKSFYLDCQLNHIPVAYHPAVHLFALVSQCNLFILDIETMKYETINIPFLKNIQELSFTWKNIAFSKDGNMLFLSEERYLLGWNRNMKEYDFFWSRKRCQPRYYESHFFKAENTKHSIYIYDNGQRAEWKEDDKTVLCFNPEFQKKLNSIYIVDKSNKYMVLLYEDNTVQVLERNFGAVYSEDIPVEKLRMDLDFPQIYCPALLWRGELWNLVFRKIQKPLYDNEGNYIITKKVTYSGITAAAIQKGKGIAIFDEQGQFLREKRICLKEQPEILSDEEMNLMPEMGTSELLREYICKTRDEKIYECNTYEFIDKDNLLIGCTKGYLYLWEMKEDILIEIDKFHKKDIEIIQIDRQWNTIITADNEGIIAIRKYKKEYNKIFCSLVSSIDTKLFHIMIQLISENEMAVFCNDTGELILYTDYRKEDRKVQTLLSVQAAKKNNICQVLSIYITADKSRLVVCRQNGIDFVQIPDGKIVLESRIHGTMKELKIDSQEETMQILMKDNSGYDFKEKYLIAYLTDKELDKILADRRLYFFGEQNNKKTND